MTEVQIQQLRDWFSTGSVDSEDLALTSQEEDFSALLRAYGLDGYYGARELVHVRHGELACLTSRPGPMSAISPVAMETRDIDRYKDWIGTPDSTLEAGGELVSSFDLPRREWRRGGDFDPRQLTEAELADIERASWHYIFGYSPSVAGYREAIERVYAPFALSIFAARKIVIEAGGELLLPEGEPAVLLFEEMEIEQGGHVRFMSPFNLTVRHLRKVAAPAAEPS